MGVSSIKNRGISGNELLFGVADEANIDRAKIRLDTAGIGLNIYQNHAELNDGCNGAPFQTWE
jgi:hypothetical protein